MESSEFITKTDSTTGITCITNGNSFALYGSLVNSCNYTRIEEIQNRLGVAHFNLILKYDYEIFYAISNTKKSELCVVVVKDRTRMLVTTIYSSSCQQILTFATLTLY